jgi:hypothetical protein
MGKLSRNIGSARAAKLADASKNVQVAVPSDLEAAQMQDLPVIHVVPRLVATRTSSLKRPHTSSFFLGRKSKVPPAKTPYVLP